MFPAASPDAGNASTHTRWTAADTIALIAIAVYAALQISLTIQHDPWLDEAQAWLVATSLSRPIDWLILPSEGHPPLWHWLLRALSTVLDFSEARYLSTVVAIGNAFLLWRLLRGTPLLVGLMLSTFVVLQSWGYHFRPYGVVFALLLSALLLDRSGRRQAATWCLAIACGFHFFAGFLFAFWLVWQWQSGTKLRRLILPALLAALFGASAIISGMGNTTVGAGGPDVLSGILNNLAWIGLAPPIRHPITAVVTFALLIYALRSRPVLLVTLLVLLVLFATGNALVYGKYPWHFAFMTMLCFTAIVVTGLNRERQWVLAILLLPQVAFGLAGLAHRFNHPRWAYPDLFDTIATDAGAAFQPQTDLVGWPDMVGPPFAATRNVEVINGNDGTLLGPLDWRRHNPEAFAPVLTEKPGPYWLVCVGCDPLLKYLGENGRTATLLASKFNIDNGMFYAYRID